MLTGFCRTVVSTNELHGNTLPERIVGSSGLLLSFRLEPRNAAVVCKLTGIMAPCLHV
jgi:hypothetical protein